jgi:hypothetical protein
MRSRTVVTRVPLEPEGSEAHGRADGSIWMPGWARSGWAEIGSGRDVTSRVRASWSQVSGAFCMESHIIHIIMALRAKIKRYPLRILSSKAHM